MSSTTAEIRPSAELVVIVTDASGHTKTLDSNAPDPRDRPTGIQFGTQLGSGFHTGGFALANPIDRDRDDIHLLDEVKFIGAGGDTAYEGFVGAMPRSMDDTHSLSVTVAGWVAHAQDETFRQIFVDRDLGSWGDVSIQRRANLIGAGLNPDGGSTSAVPDATGAPGLVSTRPGVLNNPVNEVVYDAGPGAKIARIYVGSQTLVNLLSGDANLGVVAAYSDDDKAFTAVSSDLKALSTIALDITPHRYVLLDWRYNAATGGTAGVDYSVRWQNVAVYGDHGLTRIGASEPKGVSASDVVKYLAGRYCPLLNTSGVQITTYPIAHLVFRDDTKPYDAMLRVNAFHEWLLAVWEDRTLHYGPADLTDWDWEIRHDEVGNTIGLQGDSAEELRNGLKVHFTNVATGAVETLLPDDHSQLRDDSIENPANLHGRRMYGEAYTIPWPTTRDNALELGRIKLNEDNQVKAPGSFTVRGHIRDRSGQWQPAWRVRAGDRIRLTSSASLSDRPRLIHETQYSHDGRSVTIGVDSTLRYLEAYVDRVQTALAASNLS